MVVNCRKMLFLMCVLGACQGLDELEVKLVKRPDDGKAKGQAFIHNCGCY